MSFKDHFSAHARDYARYRPTYPGELFAWLSQIAPQHTYAWDCATGNGQAAVGLAAYFDSVIATDASSDQLRNAEPHPRIVYRIAPAERSGLKTGSIDLIAVAQALHWLDLPRFFAEANRVMRPAGVLAAWAYKVVRITPEIDRVIGDFYTRIVGPFWPPGRAIVEAGYATIDFPFEELNPPRFEMKACWTLSQLVGYLRTWSATQKYIAARKTDPLDHLEQVLLPLWRDHRTRTIRWPLSLRVGRKQEHSFAFARPGESVLRGRSNS
jgi:Methylase involved in ubiquinone/menaquinone biosynthesis